MNPARTTLVAGAPWPATTELEAAIAASNEQLATRLALQLKAKKTKTTPRKYLKVKP